MAKDQQGKKLGIKMINALSHIADELKCYKTTLVCSTANIEFYKRCGFYEGQNEMRRDLGAEPKRTVTPQGGQARI